MQSSQANCGPYALYNALAALGIQRNEAELEHLCRTSATDGTSLRNLFKAAARIEGCTPYLIKEKRTDVALLKLTESIRRGRPAILSWRSDAPSDHWVAVIGMLGDRFTVADSGHSELVLSMPLDAVEAHWRDNVYVGVVL